MNQPVRQSPSAWLNSTVLRWAREWRGIDTQTAARKVQKTPETILEWEAGRSTPTVRQARDLARLYQRHFLEFLLPEPPNLPEPILIPDYRMHSGADAKEDQWVVQNTLRWAESQRTNALDLFGEIGESPPDVPSQLFTSLYSDPEQSAREVRILLPFELNEQTGLLKSEAYRLPAILRDKLEAIGILTLRESGLQGSGVRGICLATFPLPVIVFRSEAPPAQAFTLIHEFGHVLVRQSAITGNRSEAYDQIPVENWCNQFAAAFLMPADEIQRLLGPPSKQALTIADERLGSLASHFHVSQHAMLIRLVTLEYVSAHYYWHTKRKEFEEVDVDERSFGRSKYYGSRFRTRQGDLYTGLVLEAWSNGRITDHNAAEFMGIKRLSHLYDIRENFHE